MKIVDCIAKEIELGSWGKPPLKSHNPRPRELVWPVAEELTLSRLQYGVTLPAMCSDNSYLDFRSVAHSCGSLWNSCKPADLVSATSIESGAG